MASSRNPSVPMHGFETPDFIDLDEFSEYASDYKEILERRESRWDQVYRDRLPHRGLRSKRFCRKGIPREKRQTMWMYFSGAEERMLMNPRVYKDACKVKPPPKLLNVILADVPRTFPENKYFRDPNHPESKLASLERVLCAFAVQFPKVGYCQGMNYITAVLLLVLSGSPMEAEERAFWLLDALINHILQPYYSSDMFSVEVDCAVFEELLRMKLPDIHRIIVGAGINCTLLATKWFICLFADVLPIETTLRIFDCLFYEGDKILFRACLTLVKLHHNDLLKCREFPVLITAFRNMCRDSQTLHCHEFMEAMFSLPGSLSKRLIRNLRSQCAAKISATRELGVYNNHNQ